MTWSVIKEAIGKNSSRRQKFPNKINLGSKFITSADSIAENFSKYFTEIGRDLASKINTPLANFDTYLNNTCNIFQPEDALSINELKDTLYSLKTKKSSDYDDIVSILWNSILVLWIDLYIISIFLYNRVVFQKKWKLLGSLRYLKEVKYLI